MPMKDSVRRAVQYLGVGNHGLLMRLSLHECEGAYIKFGQV